jgi:Leucine-rich repeat (LRR) protein
MDHRAEGPLRSVAGSKKRLVRAGIGVALWALLIASFLYLGYQWDRLRHRQAALDYLRARNATIEIETENQNWFSLAPVLGKESLLRVRSIRFDEAGAVDADLAQIAAFEELAELSLRNGDVSDESASNLNQLQSLTSLDLSGTRFGDNGLAKLQLSNIRSLDLSGSFVSDTGITTIAQWNTLSKLRLHSVSASDATLARVSRLPRLTELDLSFTEAAEETLIALGRHPQLSILHLNGCPITDEHLEVLSENSTLTSLSLEETSVGDVGISRLSNCHALVRLILNRTRVTDRALQALRPMTNLLQIEAENTEISRGALEQFRSRQNKARKPIPTPEAGSNAGQLPWNVCEIR